MVIYKTINLVTGKIYIGQNKNNNPNYLGSGKILKQSIKKYGEENFIKEILEECKTQEELNEREIYWIKELDSTNSKVGYNIAKGGKGSGGLDTFTNNPRKEEIREKIRKAAIKQGQDKVKRRIATERLLKTWESESKRKLASDKSKELWKDAEFRANQSKIHSGVNSSKWLGYVHIFNTQNELVGIYETLKEAAKSLGKCDGRTLRNNAILNKPITKGLYKNYSVKINKNKMENINET